MPEHITPPKTARSGKRERGNAMLFDMHCHLDFVESASDFCELAEICGVTSISNTVAPEDFARLGPTFARTAFAHLALGAHPWWVADGSIGEKSLELFEQLAESTPFIGEVGLDFKGERAQSKERQLAALERVLTAAAAAPKAKAKAGARAEGKAGAEARPNAGPETEAESSAGPGSEAKRIVSLHGSGAERELLDLLERTDATKRCSCILHWYAGPADQLHRAVDLGCFFSVGKRMLKTKRGSEYARVIPLERLLLESDMPSKEHSRYTPGQWNADLTEALLMAAAAREADPDELREAVNRTSRRLLAAAQPDEI